jgi:hypothetical protein
MIPPAGQLGTGDERKRPAPAQAAIPRDEVRTALDETPDALLWRLLVRGGDARS